MMYNRTPAGERESKRERERGVVIVGGRRKEVAALSVLRDKTMSLELLPSRGRRVHMQEAACGVAGSRRYWRRPCFPLIHAACMCVFPAAGRGQVNGHEGGRVPSVGSCRGTRY